MELYLIYEMSRRNRQLFAIVSDFEKAKIIGTKSGCYCEIDEVETNIETGDLEIIGTYDCDGKYIE